MLKTAKIAPAITSMAPMIVKKVKCSGAIHETCNPPNIPIVIKVITGFWVIITLTLFASRYFKATASDPYAARVFSPKNMSNNQYSSDTSSSLP